MLGSANLQILTVVSTLSREDQTARPPASADDGSRAETASERRQPGPSPAASGTASVRAASLLQVVPPVSSTNPSEPVSRGDPDASRRPAGSTQSGSTDPGAGAGEETSNASDADEERQATGAESEKTDAAGLTEEERAEVQRLKQRDREVRRHEQAHASVGGPYAGAPRYQFERGPDGRQYAISGSVSMDVSAIPNNPSATIRKMDVVIRAALAPAEPSAQDRRVAAEARQTRLQAQGELREEKAEEQSERIEASAERRAELAEADGTPDRSRFTEAARSYGAANQADAARPEAVFSLVA